MVSFRWTPHPVMVTIRDNRDYIRVLLYSYYYTTITGWGVLLRYPLVASMFLSAGMCKRYEVQAFHDFIATLARRRYVIFELSQEGILTVPLSPHRYPATCTDIKPVSQKEGQGSMRHHATCSLMECMLTAPVSGHSLKYN